MKLFKYKLLTVALMWKLSVHQLVDKFEQGVVVAGFVQKKKARLLLKTEEKKSKYCT